MALNQKFHPVKYMYTKLKDGVVSDRRKNYTNLIKNSVCTIFLCLCLYIQEHYPGVLYCSFDVH